MYLVIYYLQNIVKRKNLLSYFVCGVKYIIYICIIRNKVITIKRYTIMATSVIKQRTIEKFIMSEFVQGNLNTKEQVSCMLILIQKKLGMSVEQASGFMRNAIGINA